MVLPPYAVSADAPSSMVASHERATEFERHVAVAAQFARGRDLGCATSATDPARLEARIAAGRARGRRR